MKDTQLAVKFFNPWSLSWYLHKEIPCTSTIQGLFTAQFASTFPPHEITHTCALFGTLSSKSQNQYHHIPGRVSLFTFTFLIVSDAVCMIGSCPQSRELLEAKKVQHLVGLRKTALNLLPRAVGNCLNS